MAVARWKDLCIDATDAGVVGRFWAGALGLDFERQAGGDAVLRGGAPERTVWVDQVPEPKVGKDRVHLDLRVEHVDRLLDLGATVAPSEPAPDLDPDPRSWTVMADPEGHEICAFTGDEPTGLVVDSTDPRPLASWWAEVLGASLVPAPDGARRWLADVPGLPFDRFKVVGVPEAKAVKNRLHWDVVGDVGALLERGARVLVPEGGDRSWTVMADPQGNEFCVFAP